jgi:hypothetical protein
MKVDVLSHLAWVSRKADAAAWSKRTKQLLWWAVGLASLWVLFGPAYAKHIQYALDNTFINDDVQQQIFPFYTYADSTLFPNDYISDYYRLNLPFGFHAFYWLGAKVWDPEPLSLALPYPLLLITVGGLAATAYRLAGGAAAWAVAALALSSGMFMDRIVGGLPRAFGFPLFAWGLYALVAGRPKLLGVFTALGITFYPVVGVVLGGTLGLWLLFWPAKERGEAEHWSLKRRAVFLSIVAGACVLLTAVVLVIGKGYGDRIGPKDITEFPEAGAGGRYDKDSRPPFAPVHAATWKQWRKTLAGQGKAFAPSVRPWKKAAEAEKKGSALFVGITAFVLVGFGLLARSSQVARRVLPFVIVALGGYVAAVWTSPLLYLPERYTNYTVALLAVLLTSVAAAGYAELFKSRWSAKWLSFPVFRNILVFVCAAGILLAVGGRGSSTKGYSVRVKSNASLYKTIAALPKDSLIAGWPSGPVQLVPHLSRRSALVTYETHQAFHKDYTLEMRKRTSALIDAYYASDTAPLIKLREEFGVTHLIVDFRHLNDQRPFAGKKRKGENRRLYFRPFTSQTLEASSKLGNRKRSVLHRLKRKAMFRRGTIAVFDLRRITR